MLGFDFLMTHLLSLRAGTGDGVPRLRPTDKVNYSANQVRVCLIQTVRDAFVADDLLQYRGSSQYHDVKSALRVFVTVEDRLHLMYSFEIKKVNFSFILHDCSISTETHSIVQTCFSRIINSMNWFSRTCVTASASTLEMIPPRRTP
jgi:hypothetical protein